MDQDADLEEALYNHFSLLIRTFEYDGIAQLLLMFSRLRTRTDLSLQQVCRTLKYPELIYLLCKKEGAFLRLYRALLSTVPKEIARLTQLKQLDLSFNKLTTLPETYQDLVALEYLSLENNKLEEVPAVIIRPNQLHKNNFHNYQAIIRFLNSYFLQLSPLNLPVGVYVLYLSTSNGEQLTQQIIKQ